MILVGQYDSPYVRRVAISLHLFGMPFERDTRSVFGDADAMRAINPLGRIPSLVLDDGEVLIDSAAILDHLDEVVGPERALLPVRGRERRRALQLTALATGTLDKIGAIVYERSLRPVDKQHEPWVERCQLQFESGLRALEAITGPAWFSDRILQPDIMTACVVAYVRLRIPALFTAERYPRLDRIATACEALPAFVQTRPALDEVMPAGL
ncbi:MAG: glutathione S-transferase N-terminal domain-containing protein [Kofleriaceae bacterium]